MNIDYVALSTNEPVFWATIRTYYSYPCFLEFGMHESWGVCAYFRLLAEYGANLTLPNRQGKDLIEFTREHFPRTRYVRLDRVSPRDDSSE